MCTGLIPRQIEAALVGVLLVGVLLVGVLLVGMLLDIDIQILKGP
jgi:hypothetical protein